MKTSTLIKAGLIAVLSMASWIAQAAPTVQELADQWAKAYNEHDKAALENVYTETAHLYMHGAPSYKGQTAIGDFWASDFTEGNPITVLTVTHSVDGADMILVHGNYQVLDRDNGKELGGGRFAHIWLMDEKGTWKLDRDLWYQPFEPYAAQ